MVWPTFVGAVVYTVFADTAVAQLSAGVQSGELDASSLMHHTHTLKLSTSMAVSEEGAVEDEEEDWVAVEDHPCLTATGDVKNQGEMRLRFRNGANPGATAYCRTQRKNNKWNMVYHCWPVHCDTGILDGSLQPSCGKGKMIGDPVSFCIPPTTPTTTTTPGPLFILGYGSLMKEWSSAKTKCGIQSITASGLDGLVNTLNVRIDDDETLDCIANVQARSSQYLLAKASGIRRGWYYRASRGLEAVKLGLVQDGSPYDLQALDLSPTVLGAVPDASAEIYAVIYPVDQAELEATDIRETGYDHLWVDTASVEVLTPNASLPSGARVRWYGSPSSTLVTPTSVAPICQSYVDLVLGGAMDLASKQGVEGFAENVVATIYDWSSHWVNDRVSPYRPWANEKSGSSIERALMNGATKTGSTLSLDIMEGITFPGGVGQPARGGAVPTPPPAGGSPLHPQAAGDGPLYIMGYGSLMKEYSSAKTKCGVKSMTASQLDGLLNTLGVAIADEDTKECFEDVSERSSQYLLVKAKGVRRGWFFRASRGFEAVKLGLREEGAEDGWERQALDLSGTALGAYPDADSEAYVVIYPVDRDELDATDAREDGYDHLLIAPSDVEVLNPNASLPSNAQIRWYASRPETVIEATAVSPIVQSYVDLVVGGAMELQEKFGVDNYAKNVVNTIHAWSSHWVTDRASRYRPHASERLAKPINKVLVEATQEPGATLTLEHLSGITFPGGVQQPALTSPPPPTPAPGGSPLHPQVPADGPKFIMGYGSLLKEYSSAKSKCGVKSLTASMLYGILRSLHVGLEDPEKAACFDAVEERSSQYLLVKANGIRRGWFYRASRGPEAVKLGVADFGDPYEQQALDLSPVVLGAVPDDEKAIYAAIYPVDDAELAATDERETGYDHLLIDPSDIEVLTPGASLPVNAQVRWYASRPETVRTPSSVAPICQSYIDLVVGGALELEEKQGATGFAEGVVATIYGWSGEWVNDRKSPYRPHANDKFAKTITKTLVSATTRDDAELSLEVMNSIYFPGKLQVGPA